jgi:hypothetical protein
MSRFESYSDLPGQATIHSRPAPLYPILASVAGAAWPPLLLTLPFWPPKVVGVGRDLDWRLLVLLIGLVVVPLALWRIIEERRRSGRPGSRLGVVWRFMLFGGLAAAAVQVVWVLGMTMFGWFEAGDVMQALGATETTLLIFGVGGLPIAMVVGVSYALWAGLCAAFIAFEAKPAVKNRLGLMPKA